METTKTIYDVGLHRGEDSEFYLKKGFRVVAIDANAEMCTLVGSRLRRYVENGTLVIINKAISANDGQVSFFKNRQHTQWGTTDPLWVARNARKGETIEEVTVESARLSHLIEECGQPYYVKIDIEGLDTVALASLRGAKSLPRFVSIESEKVSFTKLRQEFELFVALGYDQFKIVPQHLIHVQRPPNPAREGKNVDHRFEMGSSGLFGEELPGSWMTSGEAIEAYKPIFLRYHLTGDDPLVRSRIIRAGLRRLGFRAGWYDTHARRSLD